MKQTSQDAQPVLPDPEASVDHGRGGHQRSLDLYPNGHGIVFGTASHWNRFGQLTLQMADGTERLKVHRQL